MASGRTCLLIVHPRLLFLFFFNSVLPLSHPRPPILALSLFLVAFYSVRFGPLAVRMQKIYRVYHELRAFPQKASLHINSPIQFCRFKLQVYKVDRELFQVSLLRGFSINISPIYVTKINLLKKSTAFELKNLIKEPFECAKS